MNDEIQKVLDGEIDGCVIQGDCLDILPTLPDGCIDAVVTDPPYGTTACKWDTIIPLDEMWNCLGQVANKQAPIVLFGGEPFSSVLRVSNLKQYKYDWVWEKSKATGFLNSKKRPLKSHENICVFCRNAPTYYPQMRSGKPYNKGVRAGKNPSTYGTFANSVVQSKTGDRYPLDIVYFTTAENEGQKHPTQKPVALMGYLLATYTKKRQVVLDFACGSGTTLVAAKSLGRRYIGIELDERYCEIARSRLRDTPRPLFDIE